MRILIKFQNFIQHVGSLSTVATLLNFSWIN